MSAISPPERPRHNVALIISICLNLVLAGIITMAVFRFIVHPPMNGAMNGPMSGPMASQPERQQVRQIMSPRVLMRAAPDKRDAIRGVSRNHRAQLDALREATLATRREVLRLYMAPALDRPALEKALVRMQQADAALEMEAVKATADAAVALSPEERKAVINWQPRDHELRVGARVRWQQPGDKHGDAPPPPPQANH